MKFGFLLACGTSTVSFLEKGGKVYNKQIVRWYVNHQCYACR